MICPKCGYVRKETDMAPEWQCPACQVVYEKAAAAGSRSADLLPPAVGQRPAVTQSTSHLLSLKTIVTLALLLIIGYGAYNFFSNVTITREPPENVDTSSAITAPDKTVLLYSSSSCEHCRHAREFLVKHNIAFEEIDVYSSERGKEDFAKLGGIGVPILIIADTKIVGFDEGQIKSILKEKGMWR